jgi:hypothetical protein
MNNRGQTVTFGDGQLPQVPEVEVDDSVQISIAPASTDNDGHPQEEMEDTPGHMTES